jgi:hypothetical protein
MALAIYIGQKEFAKALYLDSLIMGYGVAFGIVMFLVGAIGWYAAKWEKKWMVGIVSCRPMLL